MDPGPYAELDKPTDWTRSIFTTVWKSCCYLINSGLPGYKFPNMQKSLVTVSGEEITKAGNFPRGGALFSIYQIFVASVLQTPGYLVGIEMNQ